MTITEEATTGVTFTKNFNPFDTNSMATQMNMRSLTYEPLFEFNALQPGVIHPWLGKSYTWSNGGKTLTVDLRTGVKFSDGQPMTSADVAYTFNTMNSSAAANYSGVPALASVTTPDSSTVVLNFKAAQYANIFAIAGDTFIVPKHAFSSLGNVATATVAVPVGTGPYVLKSFTTQLVTFSANPHYWGGTPPISTVQIPYYSGNTAATTALAAGQLDWAGNEIPNLQQLYVSKDSTHNHYWFPGGNTVTLWINVSKGGPLADPKVRQAISAGLNRQELSQKGEYGYEAPATSSSGLILPAQQQFLDPALANDISPTPDASKVSSLLSGDGYTKDSKGMWAKNGQEISFQVEDPTAFTDYYADAQLIAGQLKAVGINATVNGVAAPAWFTDAANGNFQTPPTATSRPWCTGAAAWAARPTRTRSASTSTGWTPACPRRSASPRRRTTAGTTTPRRRRRSPSTRTPTTARRRTKRCRPCRPSIPPSSRRSRWSMGPTGTSTARRGSPAGRPSPTRTWTRRRTTRSSRTS